MMEGLNVGDPSDPANYLGPLINAKQRDKVQGMVDRAVADGATVVTGGTATDHEKGFFFKPTMIIGADENSEIVQDEVFGPVLVILPHDGDDDAVRFANNSKFGLSGAVMAADRERALAAARRVRTGTMSVNGGLWHAPGCTVRRLQAVGHRPRERRRRVRGVPADQGVRRAAGGLNPSCRKRCRTSVVTEAVVPTADELMGNHAGSIRDLGILTAADGDTLVADIEVRPELWLPGTDVVRTSVLVDAGRRRGRASSPTCRRFLASASRSTSTCICWRCRAAQGSRPGRSLTARSWVVRAGQRIVVMGVELFDADGRLFAVGNAGFMASPNPAHEVSDGFPLDTSEERFRLAVPFADRVGLRRTGNGIGDGAVPSRQHQRDRRDPGRVARARRRRGARRPDAGSAPIESMSLRYLRGFRGSAAHATARDRRHGSVASEIVDDEGRLGTLVTVRFAPA